MNRKVIIAYLGSAHSLNDLLLHYCKTLKSLRDINYSCVLLNSISELNNLVGQVIVIYSISFEEYVIENISKIKTTSPNAKIIVFSNLTDAEFICHLFEQGVHAHISIADKISQLETSLSFILENKTFHSIVTHELITKSYANSRQVPLPATNKPLTMAEIVVVKYICHGYTSGKIATELNRSESTIKNHRHKIYEKTGVNNISDLMTWARKNNFDTTLPPKKGHG